MRYFEHFNLKECFVNCSPVEVDCAIRNNFIDSLCVLLQVLDGFRDFINVPIIITSGYRDKVHNEIVHGSPTSQHMLGEAIDFKVEKISIKSAQLLFKDFLKSSSLKMYVGQVIFYSNFIHIALKNSRHPNLSYHYE